MTISNLSLARSADSLKCECANTGPQSLKGEMATLHEPYQLLWHQYDALETYSGNQSNPKDYRTHITVLLEFLRTCAMPNVQELIGLCNPQNTVQSISFPSLWFLFTPGKIVVTQGLDLSYSRAYSIDTVEPPSKKIDAKGRFVYGKLRLSCQKISYDGKGLGFVSTELIITAFQGVTLLSKLDYIPLSLLEAHEEKRGMLIARGRKFWDLRGQHLKEFVDSSYADGSLVVWASLFNLLIFTFFMATRESFRNK